MNNITPSIQKLLVAIIILSFVGYVVYSTLFTSSEVIAPIDGVLTESVGQDIIILADKLDKINLQKNIFVSPLFTNLIDVSSPVVDEPEGRSNPFSQIGADGTVSKSQSTSSR